MMSQKTSNRLKEMILEGIPDPVPEPRDLDPTLDHAPKRKESLNEEEKRLALRNALRYFPKEHHPLLAPEFAEELRTHGRIYMHRFRPDIDPQAYSIDQYPHRCKQAAAIMLMINNNLDRAVAQHPQELITYGGNGAVFQNWAQYRLTMKYLAEMEEDQTLVLYSGHPLGLFPSHQEAPRMVVTNGMMIPQYSELEHWEKYNALGVTQYGQMTAGSFMYIGPQGIVHGTTITVLNAGRRLEGESSTVEDLGGKLFVSSGLGGMSGAQPKAAVIAGAVGVIAEINPKAAQKRQEQGWVDEVYEDLDELLARIGEARAAQKGISLAYRGNVVDLWEKLAKEEVHVDLGSDQTSLHNPYAGGYYPVDVGLEEANEMMAKEPERFKEKVHESLKRQVEAINSLSEQGMYFFDYGNAFLVQASKAGADVETGEGKMRYPSYVQDIMGPMCFDYGFGPFRWICSSNDPEDLERTDEIAKRVLRELYEEAPPEIRTQLSDNLRWIGSAAENRLVVGAQARILYADQEGRIRIAKAFNEAIRQGELKSPVVLGRDHHDVSGTDSPFRETSNIYDGSAFTADMAVHNVIGDAFRGATWVSLHNGGGVGWGKVINGGFGMVLDGSDAADRRIERMLHWDVSNGLARRSWARNDGAMRTIERVMEKDPKLKVTLPAIPDEQTLDNAF
ncbi:MAG: urocanate hydratase [Flavobacteriales bacterium]